MNHVNSTDNSPIPVSRAPAAQLPRLSLQMAYSDSGVFGGADLYWERLSWD